MPKKILINFNPISGAGKAEFFAELLGLRLEADGHVVQKASIFPTEDPAAADRVCRDSDLILLCGGDGTLRAWLPILHRRKIPVWLAPAGNESLFCREFSMTSDVRDVQQALEHWDIRQCDLGKVGDEYFATMCSIGLDAEVVRILSARRCGTVGTRGYVVPSVQALLSFRPSALTITVDDQLRTDKERGFFIVANSSQYARAMKLSEHAKCDDGLLDVSFFQGGKKFYFSWLLPLLLRTEFRAHERHLHVLGKKILVRAEQSQSIQADGDYIGQTPCEISILPGGLRVLVFQK